MASQIPQQTTPLTPPSTPPTPKAPLPTTTITALPAPPLRLSPSYSPLSSSSNTSSLPRITITLNNRTLPPLPWRPCNPRRPCYESSYLAPPRQSDLSRHHRRQQQQPREHERQAQQHAEEEEPLLREASHLSVPEAAETQQLPSLSLLRPIARELIRWRMLTFYNLNRNLTTAAEARARANILAAGVDWQRTWVLLRDQRARYLARERRSLGLLLGMNLRGLGVLRVVHRTGASAGVGVEQLILAVEAFAKREGGEGGNMSVRGLVARREWDVLAGVLLMDREMQGREWGVSFPTSRSEREGVWEQICRKREEVARRYFSGLEYEEPCAGFCCFARCGKRRMVYQLSRRERARLDGSLELQGQLRRGVHSTGISPRRRESESERDNGDEGSRENGPEVQTQKKRKKRVRIREDVDEEQEVRSESASRASWDSEQKRQKRRKERREFVFGKEDEDEDEDESDAEGETDDQREEQERKRKQSLERILAANARWNEEYADC